jgi:hypothetical protein
VKPSLAVTLAFLALAFGPSGLTGCGATCDRRPNVEPTRYVEGSTDLEEGFYETSPWDGPYLFFPKGRTYLLVHGLGARPRDVRTWLSFQEEPIDTAPGAGNQVLVEGVTDEHIQIRNDTCSDVCLRVTASHPEAS